MRKVYCSSVGTLGFFILVAVVLATAAAAGELSPDTAEMLAPLSDTEVGEEVEAPEGAGVRSVPFEPLVDPDTYRALKAQARRTPAAQPVEALEKPSEPEPSAAVTQSFTGLNQQEAGNLVPPDTILGVSNTRALEAVNTAVRLFNKSTTPPSVIQTKSLNSFFGASTSQGTLFDPKVYFDRNAVNRRFYVVALQMSGTSDATGFSRIWLAVSRSSDPANLEPANWCRYAINSKRNAGTALSSWADYPGLGVGADKLVISANQFTFPPPPNRVFTFAILRVFNKLIAANNAGACPSIPFFTFQPSSTSGNGGVFTLQPAQHYTSPSSFSGISNPVYLINTIFGTSATYRVWRVSNINPPSLQGPTNVNGNVTYGLQPDAPQSGSAIPLDTGDTRVTQVAGLGNLISGVHGTVCNAGGGANESCVRYVRILVGGAGSTPTATINDQTFFTFGAGNFVFWPGVAVNSAGQAAIAYHRNLNGAGARFLSSLVTLRSGGALVASFFITSGTCTLPASPQTNPPQARTGDYIGAQTNPSDFTSFYLAGERATVISGSCLWQTQIIRLVP
jgi:hypothetical protein